MKIELRPIRVSFGSDSVGALFYWAFCCPYTCKYVKTTDRGRLEAISEVLGFELEPINESIEVNPDDCLTPIEWRDRISEMLNRMKFLYK
mgnify:CR=1 FL=1